MINTQSSNTTAYSFFSNTYILTEEICAEAEISRIDTGIAIIWMLLMFFVYAMFPALPSMVDNYFSSPSLSTVIELSGGIGIQIISPIVAVVCLIKAFPKLVGAKRFQEQLTLVPSKNRTLEFYDEYVEITGKLKQKFPYKELKRIGETKNLYILYFKQKRILFVHKSGFHKGTLRDLKQFIRERRTWSSKVYGIIRYLPVLLYLILFSFAIWEG